MKQSETTLRLNKYLNTDIGAPMYEEARNFLFIWNLFESKFFPTRNSINYTTVTTTALSVDEELINATIAYFQSKYLTENNTNGSFNGLKLANKQKRFVSSVLLGCSAKADKIAATIFIIYRYRNNLFHGTKRILDIPNQTDIFRYANRFMLSCLESNIK